MRALRMGSKSRFCLILWVGGTAALILTMLLIGCTPGSGAYFWSDQQPVLDLGVPRPLDKASGSFDGEWTLSGTRSSAPSSLRIRWNQRSDGNRIETYSSLSARRLRSLTGGFRSGEVSIIESRAGELTLRVTFSDFRAEAGSYPLPALIQIERPLDKVRVDIKYKSFVMNQPIEQDLFHFTPPANAKVFFIDDRFSGEELERLATFEEFRVEKESEPIAP